MVSPSKKQNKRRTQCHFISNTHWDREWRFSMQRTRYKLVYMMDMLLDILEKYPEYKSFHLDSQTIPLQDYLEIRPEREELIKKYVREDRLCVGPWFCLPDEFSVSGESLIRNLLLGHRIARKFGKVSKTGYSPFSWGQISQMPQIYNGFGIGFTAFYRGVNTIVAPRSEFVWEGPDGSRLLASRLAHRPRYNIWYVVQRPVYWNMKDENERIVSWNLGHGPFRFIDEEYADLDFQYAHQKYEYHREHIAERAQQAYDEQDGDWTTQHRFWSAGHDSSCPDIREVCLIADCNEALKDKADVFHSNFSNFQKSVCENANPDLPVTKGEMRHLFTKGSTSPLYGWIISARMDVKLDNFKTERTLISYAEPLAVFASILGTPYPRAFIDKAFNWLLQNHGHDSIGGCSRDVVHKDMFFRSGQVREISSCITEQAMMTIAGSINLSDYSPDDVAIVVYNPAPFKRTEVLSAVIETPKEWPTNHFEIVDANGNKADMQFCDKLFPHYSFVQSPNDCANMIPSTRHFVRAEFADVPGLGYRTFHLKPAEKGKLTKQKTMLTGQRTMENEHLAVTINSNGTLSVKDKQTGHLFDEQGYFHDCSEIGNPWEHKTVPEERVFTTLDEKADVRLVRDGELETSFQVSINWSLPKGRSEDEKKRSHQLVPYQIVNTVTLRRGQPWVEVITEIENTSGDHYLRVAFPTGIRTERVMVQSQFDVVERPTAKPDPKLFAEEPQTEHPMNSFIDVSDGKIGVALLNEGLKAYEAHDDSRNTVSLTLLRCFPLRICVTQKMTDYSHTDKGSQCLGKHSFRYAIMPHAGGWVKAGVWQAAERFTLGFRAAQIGPTAHGTGPLEKSFLELKPECLQVSAVKQSESARGWIVRLFNPLDETVKGAIRLNGGGSGPKKKLSPVECLQAEFALPKERGKKWKKVRIVTLEEIPEHDLDMGADGWVGFEISRKKILTLEFLP